MSDFATEAALLRAAEEREFLATVAERARDWRYSDEYIGLLVRARYPREYGEYALTTPEPESRPVDSAEADRSGFASDLPHPLSREADL